MDSSRSNASSSKETVAPLSLGQGQSRYNKPLPPLPPMLAESYQPSPPTKSPPPIPSGVSHLGIQDNVDPHTASSSSSKNEDNVESESASFRGIHLNRVASIEKSRPLRKKISDRFLRAVNSPDLPNFFGRPVQRQPGRLRRVKGSIADRVRDFSDSARGKLPTIPIPLSTTALNGRDADTILQTAVKMRKDYYHPPQASAHTPPFHTSPSTADTAPASSGASVTPLEPGHGLVHEGVSVVDQSGDDLPQLSPFNTDAAISSAVPQWSMASVASSDPRPMLLSGGGAMIPHIRGEESAVRFAYASMRGEDNYSSRGAVYDSLPFAENRPQEDEEAIRPRDGGSESGPNRLENEAFYGGVPSEPAMTADRKPRTQKSLNNMAGYVSINGKTVDPDGFGDVYQALQPSLVEKNAGLNSAIESPDDAPRAANLPILAEHVAVSKDLLQNTRLDLPQGAGSTSELDSDGSHRPAFSLDRPTFDELVKGTKSTRKRSKTVTEQKTSRSAFELSLQGPKPPSNRQDWSDMKLARRDPDSPGLLSNYSVERWPSPKPEGEGQDLRHVPKLYARMSGMPALTPEQGPSTQKYNGPKPTKSLRRESIDAKRGRIDLRTEFFKSSPRRNKSVPPDYEYPRSRSRARIVTKGGGVYEPGVELPTVLESEEPQLTQPAQSSSSAEEVIQDDEGDATTQYNKNKTLLSSTLANIELKKASAKAEIEANQPSAQLNLSATAMAANREDQVPVWGYRVELRNAMRRWGGELERTNDQWNGTAEATNHYARQIKEMRQSIMKRLDEANRKIALADRAYYELQDGFIEQEYRLAVQEERMQQEQIRAVQREQIQLHYGVDQGSVSNGGVPQQPHLHAAPQFNSRGEFGAQQAATQQQQYIPGPLARHQYAEEYVDFPGLGANAPRDSTLQPNMFLQQQQQQGLARLDNNMARQQYDHYLQSAGNPQGQFGGQPYISQVRRDSFGQVQQDYGLLSHNGQSQFPANPAGVNSQFNRIQQQTYVSDAFEYNGVDQAHNGPVQMARNMSGETQAQAFARQYSYGALPHVGQGLAYQAQNGPPQFGTNQQAEFSGQGYAPQQQHGAYGGAQQNDMFQRQAEDSRATNNRMSYDSYLSECEVSCDSATGEFIVNPRRASRLQPGIALQDRNTLDRIDEDAVFQPPNESRPLPRNPPAGSPPSFGQPRYTRTARGPTGSSYAQIPLPNSSSPFQGAARHVTPQAARGASQPAQTPRYAWQTPYTLVRPRPNQRGGLTGMSPTRNDGYTQPSRPQNMGGGMGMGGDDNYEREREDERRWGGPTGTDESGW